MDLPTYTNIWRIEKRLYKLYDFRLPMPLPINWIAVFAGITVPYIILLVAIGLPFNHTLVWLYVLPPGLLTWLTTRPVIENKRLPELVESQVRYLAEPRVWTRLAPHHEKDQMVVTARVWHARPAPQRHKTAKRAALGVVALRERNALARHGAAAPAIGDPAEGNASLAAASALAAAPAAAGSSRSRVRARGTGSQGSAPGSSGRQRPPGRRPRQPRQDWAAQQREAAPHDDLPDETWPAEQPPQAEAANQEGQAPKPSRFRLSALRPKPAGEAPELPPGVALRESGDARRSRFAGPAPSDQAGSARKWPEEPARPGRAVPAWRMPAARSAPPLGSVTAPVPSDLPVHATPDIFPSSLPPAPDMDLASSALAAPHVYLPAPALLDVGAAPATPAAEPATSVDDAAAAEAVEDTELGVPVDASPEVDEIAPAETTEVADPVAPVDVASGVDQAPTADVAGDIEPDIPVDAAPDVDEAAPAQAADSADLGAPVDAGADIGQTPPGDAAQHTDPGTTVDAAPDVDEAAPAEATEVALLAAPVYAAPVVEAAPDTGQGVDDQASPVYVAQDADSDAPVVAAAPEADLDGAVLEFLPGTWAVATTESDPGSLSRATEDVESATSVHVTPDVAHAAPDADEAPFAPPASPGGAPRVEISHDGLAQRLVPPAPVPPVNPALAWPAAEPEPAEEGAAAGPPAAEVVHEAPPPAEAPQGPVTVAVADAVPVAIPSIERALSGPSRDRNLTWYGKVKIVAGTGQGPGKRDQEALDRARARLPLKSPRRVLMLGATSGAGQSVTTLMTGHILASLREEPVAAVDLYDGTLARYSEPAGWLEDLLRGMPPQGGVTKARPDGLGPARKAVPARLDVIASREPFRDGDELKLAAQLTRHYSLAMLDPGAAGLMKLLKITDQLVIVVPASVDGAGALADTREWLGAHGFDELAAHSVTVINGVSRRSLGDVEQAESVARGRCRAIVRVPWDDMLPVEIADP
ncbi:MAG TPA: TcpE family conjugal transfer membrane protein, partial [Trebonia sp.]|nr:TcpE family conjugal transfer membrane protein [Trebonia sp.]